MLIPGIHNTLLRTVSGSMTARAMGSGRLDVFATPALAALMEETAMTGIEPYLEVGQGTVGTKLTLEHLAATPVGMNVRCESTLESVDGRRLTFTIQAYDAAGLIGTATHERFVVDNERFMAKTRAKLNG